MVFTETKNKKVLKETFNNSEKTSSSIVTDPSEYSEYIEQNMLNEGTIVTIEEESENGTTTVKTTLKYVTDEGEEFESTSTLTQTTAVSDSKGNKIQIDPNEELLKKIRTRKISVDVEDVNGKKSC